MLRILLFVLVLNGLIAILLYLCKLLFSLPELNFISDYFFYALLIQWILSSIFLIAKPGNNHYLRHSPNTATRAAASMGNDAKGDSKQTNFDVGLSMLLFISGTFSLLMCFIL